MLDIPKGHGPYSEDDEHGTGRYIERRERVGEIGRCGHRPGVRYKKIQKDSTHQEVVPIRNTENEGKIQW